MAKVNGKSIGKSNGNNSSNNSSNNSGNSVALTPPKKFVEDTNSLSGGVVEQAKEIKIRNDIDYQHAGEFLIEVVRPALQQIDEKLNPIISKWHEGHRDTLRLKKELREPFEEAERVIDRLMGDYRREVERKQREEVKRLEESLVVEAEESAVKRAEELINAGRVEEGELILAAVQLGEIEPETEPMPMVKRVPKADGISPRKLWKFEVVDEGKVKREFLTVDAKAIGKLVRAVGDKAEKMVGEGGIKVWYEEIQAKRSR